ncbi:hypothetical protein OG948_49105 (plasmid) [Embleya sp. NBC_00888]|uniref:ABC transporter permease n=1 Tax=Embleya sp. NBC_00888 TaxID=2975960 RepID=UPI002F9155B0|nr:hypothetical protein OG948_49105 [Embleya sp. NBC_00888]
MNRDTGLAIAGAELRIMLRNKAVAATVVLLPLCVAGTSLVSPTSATVSQSLLFIQLIGVYATLTTTLAARRKDLFLKRLRSGSDTDASIITGLVLPALLVTCVQIVALVALLSGTSLSAPTNVGLLAIATVTGALMCTGVAVATSAFTSSPEQAQVTTLPFIVVAAGGSLLVEEKAPERLDWLGYLVPGGGVVDLAAGAWDGIGVAAALGAMASVAAWTLAGAAIAVRLFRWEPRA